MIYKYYIQLFVNNISKMFVYYWRVVNMTSLSEMKDREYIPNKTYVKMLIGGGLAFSKVFLTNMGDIKKLRKRKKK
jgi:hypothetical protein